MSNGIFFHRKPSPVGPLLLISDGTALVGLYTAGHHPSWSRVDGIEDASPFREVSAQLDHYFAGKLSHFDLPLRLNGTPFQQSVWAELMAIPYGTTISYRELAARIGNPRAIRAVGGANGKNPVSIIVPCHRVIGADGGLTGYGGGLDCKRWLLTHEHARVPHRTGGYGSWTERTTAVAR